MSDPTMPDDDQPRDGASPTDDGEHPGGPAEMPFTERHRLPVGLVAAAACVAVAIFFAVVGPASAVQGGAFGLIMRWGTPVLWGLLAVVAITWAVRMPRKLTNGMASVVLIAYLAYLIARSV